MQPKPQSDVVQVGASRKPPCTKMTKALVTTGAIIITIIAETDPAHTSKCAKKKHQKSTATMAEKVEKAALDNQTRPEGVFRKDKSLEKEYITPEEPRTIFTGEADKSRRNQSKETVSSSGSSVTGFMKFVDRAFGK
ncbi:MAG: hypothetical protein MMC33_000218 [Icmadophila ericetorum]|nr:hypothetical protein [Icmadophila ericetorum]